MSGKVSKTSANRPVAKTERPKKAAAKTSKSSKSESIFIQSSQKCVSNTSSEDEVTKARKIILNSKKQLGLTDCNTSVAITKDNLAERAQSNLYLLIRCFEGSPANGYGLYLDDKKAKEPGQLSGGYRKVCNKLTECNNALNNITKNKFSKLPNSIREALLDLVYVRNEGVNFIRNNQVLMNAIMNDDYSTIVSNLIYIDQQNEGTVRGYYRRSFNRAVLACRDLQGKELKESVIEAEKIYQKALESFNKNGSDSKLLRDEHANFQLTYAEVLGEIQHEQAAKEAARKDSIAQAEQLAKNDSIKGVDVTGMQSEKQEDNDGQPKTWAKVAAGAAITTLAITNPGFFIGRTLTNMVKSAINKVKSWFGSEDKEYEFDENISVMENMLNDATVKKEEDGDFQIITVDYEVQEGDSLYELGERYEINYADVAKDNNIEDVDSIEVGQHLKIQKLGYKVKKGDTIESIAAKFGISPELLKDINRLDEENTISKGQIIGLPGEVRIIKEGDKLDDLAEKSGISVEKIMELNELKDTNIKADAVLKLPYKDKNYIPPKYVKNDSTKVGDINENNTKYTKSRGDFWQFSEALAGRESRGDYKRENTVGFLGKYQMGEMALVDAGFYKKDGTPRTNDWRGKWTKKAKRYGVSSKKGYLNHPKAQDDAYLAYKKSQWRAIKSKGLHKYIGKTVNGCYITASGLMAGAHLKGVNALAKFLHGTLKKTTDAYGTDIREYINKFGGYDISEITGMKFEDMV